MNRPIVSISELQCLRSAANLRIVDVRTRRGAPTAGLSSYLEGHIPGAIHIDLETVMTGSKGPGLHPLPEPRQFVDMLAAHGIGEHCTVVCYDDAGGAVASRLWWMLENVGMRSVAVLDGGYQAWREAGLPLEQRIPSYPAASWGHVRECNATVTREQLLVNLASVLILDARAANRFCGDCDSVDEVPGHIPTAVSAPFADNLRDGYFKKPEELRTRFHSLGVDDDTLVVNSCGSGVSACHNILAMRIAGLGASALYPGSWSDWSTAGYPVVRQSTTASLPTWQIA